MVLRAQYALISKTLIKYIKYIRGGGEIDQTKGKRGRRMKYMLIG